MDWKRLTASALMLGLLALPASAASITPQTTMKEIRDDPDILMYGSGTAKSSPPAGTMRRWPRWWTIHRRRPARRG